MKDNLINLSKPNVTEASTDRLIKTLSVYMERIINKDKSITNIEIPTNYFLENDNWHIIFFCNIEQFKQQFLNYKRHQKSIQFPFNSENIIKEFKFIVHNKIFSDEWGLSYVFGAYTSNIIKFAKFINEKYPNLNSLNDLDAKKANIQWIDYLYNNGIRTFNTKKVNDKEYKVKTNIANFLEFTIRTFKALTDEREEWEKNRWDVRNLKKYGITFNASTSSYFIDFNKISNIKIRTETKKYVKQRLLSNNNFSWASARLYLIYIPNFLNLICELEPTWNDLKKLERHHIEKYIEWLNIYAEKSLNSKNSNPKRYVSETLICVNRFLSDIRLRKYDIATDKSVNFLIFPEDIPKRAKKSNDQIDYVPDIILEQLFANINNLSKEVVPVVYIMFKTGLRISDVLGLKQDCLIKLNNKFWIETNIEKTYVEGHRIPIDDELAKMLAVLIDNSMMNSNEDNNPENYIFVRYRGSRKGRPYSQHTIQSQLNLLAEYYNITDEVGNRYHFKNHSFRHTYAIKMLNSGTDILTLQELLAHASPEMTMRYAKLLDTTKREVFDKAIKQGIFSFDESDQLKEENDGEIPANIIDMLYTNHKLNALDTPYGTCMQRKNGKCTYSKQPPCLTCNNGKPCKDLCVGAFEGDIVKYEILIESTKRMIENAKIYHRVDMVNESQELLNLYENIYIKISQGNMIYSRLDKLKKEVI